jgi:hypothetical protein
MQGGVFELVHRTEVARPGGDGAQGLAFNVWKPTLHRCCFDTYDCRLMVQLWQEDKLG